MSRTFRNKNSAPHGFSVRDDGNPYHVSDMENPNWRGPRYRRKWARCEKKAFRKTHYRSYRASTKDRIRHEDWEGIRPFRRTSGWMTW